ncbi:lipoprotein-releasing system permease protein [Tenacibaculum skagerrakense]|uniref:Lipoprotein-releasing system permease protein n=1 Tax=Tenacibaculum skagerrakense TaxID=186571 RepID=A0A4R2NR82_9FLAO|nr:FtsX-like permease family protein [Tenacibaculum skagerrakense]TCP24413.1 lipoprotein-releasing system permease protein [Tenacibaculum skagerrakense]
MNYELFIAKRIIAGKEHKSSISSPIIKIAIVAITLGIAIMLVSVAVSSGFQQKIRDKLAGFKGHIQISNYDNNNSDVSTVPLSLEQDFYPSFKNIEGIKKVQPFINKGGILRTPTDFQGIVFKGVNADYDYSFFNEFLVEGRLPNYNQPRNREVLISKSIVDRLQLHLNDTLQAWFESATATGFKMRKPVIVGIYNTGFEEFDNAIMVGDLKEVQRINKWKENEVGGFEVMLEDFDELQEKGNQVYSNIGATLNAVTIIDNYPAIFEWVKLFDNNVWFIIAIMVVIAGINMITALLVLILERVQMVGILKTLGSSNWEIQKVFLYNASYLIVRGLFWGNIIGLGLLLIQKYFKIIELNPETYYVSTVPVNINILHFVLLNLGTLVLCLLMLIIPSKIVSKIHPSRSIKFE